MPEKQRKSNDGGKKTAGHSRKETPAFTKGVAVDHHTRSPGAKKRRHRVNATQRASAYKAGKSSHVFLARTTLRPGDKVILCCRESTMQQGENGNLADQELFLRRFAEELGLKVTAVVRHVGSGADAYWLDRAISKAKMSGAKLLAETPSHFLRHPGYHPSEHPEKFMTSQLDALRMEASGVHLITWLNPDSTIAEEHRHFAKRGQEAEGRRGRRRNSLRETWMPTALALKDDKQMSTRMIAEIISTKSGQSVSHSTISKWHKTEGKGKRPSGR